jgi:ribosomal protein L37AE/L43A
VREKMVQMEFKGFKQAIAEIKCPRCERDDYLVNAGNLYYCDICGRAFEVRQ